MLLYVAFHAEDSFSMFIFFGNASKIMKQNQYRVRKEKLYNLCQFELIVITQVRFRDSFKAPNCVIVDFFPEAKRTRRSVMEVSSQVKRLCQLKVLVM